MFGSQFTFLALPLVAAVTLQATPFQMGLLGVCQTAPALLFALPAGVWLDRVPRRPAMVASQLASLVALATVPLAALFHAVSIPQLYAVSFATGAATVFLLVSQTAYLPSLVGREHLVEANSKYQTTRTIAQLAAPGVAGAVVQAITAPMAITFDALSYLVGAVTTAWIRRSEPAPAVEGPRRHVLAEALEGLRVLWSHPLVRSITLTLVVANAGGSLSGAVFVLLFVNHLGITPFELGLLGAAGSLTSLLGAQVARPLVARLGIGPLMVAGAVLFAAGVLLNLPAALAPRPAVFPILLAGALITGLGLMVYNVNQQAIRQSVIANHLLGRAQAGVVVLVYLGQVAGALAGGVLGQAEGLLAALVAGTLLTALNFLPAVFSPLRSLRAVPSAAGR